eukprot:2701018-Alexandrium_andersonii.AAC.1
MCIRDRFSPIVDELAAGACPHAPSARVSAGAWRRLFRAAAKRGTGPDGWGSAVLALLPEEALERLSDVIVQ